MDLHPEFRYRKLGQVITEQTLLGFQLLLRSLPHLCTSWKHFLNLTVSMFEQWHNYVDEFVLWFTVVVQWYILKVHNCLAVLFVFRGVFLAPLFGYSSRWPLYCGREPSWIQSRIITVEPPLTATSLQRPLLLSLRTNDPYMDSGLTVVLTWQDFLPDRTADGDLLFTFSIF